MKKLILFVLVAFLPALSHGTEASQTLLDRSPAFDDSAACQALALQNAIFCERAKSHEALRDCTAVLTVSPLSPHDTRGCASKDCVALKTGESSSCASDDCRAVMTGDDSLCRGVTCQAILRKDASLCGD